MLKIGEFSRYSRISIRMLRHYGRIEHPRVLSWCADWPHSVETSGDFDWGSVFRF